MKCPACGTDAPDDATFCHRCGQPLDGTADAPRQHATAKSAVEDLARQRSEGADEEAELWAGSYSAKAMIGPIVAAAVLTVAILVGAILARERLPADWVRFTWLAIAGAIALIWCWVAIQLAYRKLNVSYRLTNQRLVHKIGILRRSTDRIEVIDMDDITYDQGLIERFLGVGTIHVKSSDRTHPDFQLVGIDQVQDVAAKLDAARRQERVRRGLHVEAI